MKYKKYMSIISLLFIILNNNINSMSKKLEENNNLADKEQLGLNTIPYELLEIIYENLIGRTLNDLKDIKNLNKIKEDIRSNLLNMLLVSKSTNINYNKNYIDKLIRSLIIERLAYLIKENKKNYSGEYKELSKNEINNKLLLLISRYNNHEIDFHEIIKLISADIDINIQDKNGNTALILAIDHDHKDIIELLIAANININMQNIYNGTALISAVKKGNINAVKLLIETNADINIQNKYGYTALMIAVLNRHKNIVKLLIAAGADINIQNHDKKTALMLATLYNRESMKKLLIKAAVKKQSLK